MSRLKPLVISVLLSAAPASVLSQIERSAASPPPPAAYQGSAAVETIKVPEVAGVAGTQTQDRRALPPDADRQNCLGWPLLKRLASDQKTFWTSVRDLRRGGAKTFAPFAGFTGLLIFSDSWLAKQMPEKPDQRNASARLSRYATYSMIGVAGGSFWWGHLSQNDHAREAGLLSGEALLHSTSASYALRGVLRRERPLEGNG
jgi:hypothetical protein